MKVTKTGTGLHVFVSKKKFKEGDEVIISKKDEAIKKENSELLKEVRTIFMEELKNHVKKTTDKTTKEKT